MAAPTWTSLFAPPGGQGGYGGHGIGNPGSYGGMNDPSQMYSQTPGGALGFLGNYFSSPKLSDWGGGVGGQAQMWGAGNTLDNMFTYRDEGTSALAGGAKGALSGASAGSMFGPWGAAIGGGLGALSGAK